jgi:hypothetical protein
MMMEFLPFTEEMALMQGVASGLVEGDKAPMTPTGFAILTMFLAGSSSIMPTDLSVIMSKRADLVR